MGGCRGRQEDLQRGLGREGHQGGTREEVRRTVEMGFSWNPEEMKPRGPRGAQGGQEAAGMSAWSSHRGLRTVDPGGGASAHRPSVEEPQPRGTQPPEPRPHRPPRPGPRWPLPTRTDLSRSPPAPPPQPSRRLRRIPQLLPKLFPLIPGSAAACGVTRSQPRPRPRLADVTAPLAPPAPPPGTRHALFPGQQPIAASPGPSLRPPPCCAPGASAAPSGVRCGSSSSRRLWWRS